MLHSANLRCYEKDHFISLELGGDPQDPKNLWPEPYNPPQARRRRTGSRTTSTAEYVLAR